VEAIQTLGKYLGDNRKRLLKIDDLPQSAWGDAVGLRRISSSHGKSIWLKSTVFTEIFPGDHDTAAKLLAAAGIIVESGAGNKARQQRVPGLGTKEYFYIIDRAKLDAALQKTEGRENVVPRH
jgi:hypothetical protein